MTCARAWVSIIAIAFLARDARAVEPRSLDQCNQDLASGQRHQKGGKLLAARDAFRLCARDECPPVVASFCANRLAETESALPTIVVRVRDANNVDLADLDVSINGRVAGKSDGRALAIDPGANTIKVSQGTLSAVTSIVASEGEKLRPVAIALPSPPSTPERIAPAPAESPRSRSVFPYVLATLGGVAVGTGAAFWASGLLDRSDELDRGGCAPRCSDSIRDSIHTRLIVGDVLAIAGAVSLAVATYLILHSPHTSGAGSKGHDPLRVDDRTELR